MQLNQIKYVLKAAEHKNFSLAAKELFISQPTLSQQIKFLEEELGTALFFRHSKSVSLSPAGEEFVLYAKGIINDIEMLQTLMGEHKNLSRGKIKIGALWIVGYLELAKQIHAFSTKYPNIESSIAVDGSNVLIEQLIAKDVDVVFVFASQELYENKYIAAKQLCDDRFTVIVSDDNPLSVLPQISIKDLKNQKIIMPAKESALRLQLDKLFLAEDIKPNIVCESSQSDTSTQLAIENFGIAFSSENIAKHLVGDRAKIIPFTPTINRPVCIAALKSSFANPAIASFWRHFVC